MRVKTVQVNNTKIGTFQVFVQHLPTQLGTPVRTIAGVKPLYIAVGDKGELNTGTVNTQCLVPRPRDF